MPKVYAAELRRVRGSDDSNSAEPRSGASGAARARLKGLAGGSGTDQISIETRAKMGSLPWTPTEAALSAASGPPADPGPVRSGGGNPLGAGRLQGLSRSRAALPDAPSTPGRRAPSPRPPLRPDPGPFGTRSGW